MIYSEHCACCLPADFASLPGIRWLKLENCWEQAIRLGVVRPPALVENDTIIAQGANALEALRNMARTE